MINRSVIRLFSAALLAVFVLGCGDDEGPTDPAPSLAVTPLFEGIDQGQTLQLTASVGGQPVAVTWESQTPAKATVSPTGLVTGLDPCVGEPVTTPPCSSRLVAITATMTSDVTQRRSASITVSRVQGIALSNGVPVTGLSSSGARGSTMLYRLFVPAGRTSLTVTLRGGTGDADIYVRRATPPTSSTGTTATTCASFNSGNDEDCVIAAPAAGTWYVLIDLWDPYAGATLTATYAP